MERVDFFCIVCGSPIVGDIAANAAVCGRCGAGWRTMELASGLLGELGRGCHVVLNRLVRDPAFQQSSILDLSFDPVIERELKSIPRYRKLVFRDRGSRREDWSDWQVPINSSVPQRLPFRDGIMDALIVRDLVRTVPDLNLFIAECFRVLAPRGSLLLQDRYRWPLPDNTVTREAAAGEGAAATQETDRAAPAQIRDCGASLLAQLSDAGFMVYFERPAMSLDLLYRGGFAVGIKP